MPMANKKVARVFEVGRIKRRADPALLGGSVARENQRRIGIAVLLDAGRLVMPVYSVKIRRLALRDSWTTLLSSRLILPRYRWAVEHLEKK